MPAFVRISLLLLGAWLVTAAVAAGNVPALHDAGDYGELVRSDVRPSLAAAAPQSVGSSAGDVQISLLTILPGSNVYSLWGHSAIRVLDPRRGVDHSYNYGTFDFQTPFFVGRFLHGSLDYQLSVQDVDQALRHYRMEGRPVIEQVLDLSPDQKARLVAFLQINALPENRSYRYHFLFDNCSTRVRDAFEAALEGAVDFSATPDPDATFRQLIDPYQRAIPFLDPGIDWLLGAPVDRPVLPFDSMFLPDYLMEAFDHAAIEVEGARRPLVAQTDTLIWIDGYEPSRSRFPWEAVATWILFAVGLAVTVRRRGVVRGVDIPLYLLTGAAGLLIVYLWFISNHDVTEANWNLLWAWPTHLAAAAALLRRPPSRWLVGYGAASAVIAVAAVVASPIWPQVLNPVLVPIALLVALRGGAMWYSARRAPVAAS